MSFSRDISKFTDKVETRAELVFRLVTIDIFSQIIMNTPVGNPDVWIYKHPTKGYVDYQAYKDVPDGYTGGSLRGNWQMTTTGFKNSTLKRKDKTGASTTGSMTRKANKLKLGKTAYFVNNLPYAKAVEDGHSHQQAPSGMVRVPALKFDRLVKEYAKKVKGSVK